MSVGETIELLVVEGAIFALVWSFVSSGAPMFAGIIFVALHLIAHNGHVGFSDKNERLRERYHDDSQHRWKP